MEQLKQDFVIKHYSDPMWLYREIACEYWEIKEAYENNEDISYHLAELQIFLTDYFKSINMSPEQRLKYGK